MNLNSVLITDLYQLTMMQAYFAEGMNDIAVFEFFARKLPKERNFYVAAGLEQVIEYLTTLHFTEHDIAYLQTLKLFKQDFLEYLAAFKFSGDVYAVSEGTLLFPSEPMLQVIAPLPMAQFIESRIINLLHFQTLIASKAIRCVLAAPNKNLVDFGMRRAHGAEASVLSARANYLAGFSSTATVLAGQLFAIPVIGTMAHSYVQAHMNETEAFVSYAKHQPNNVTLLIDTYDIESAANKVVELAKAGIKINAVRIDSGDLYQHAVNVRNILDAHNCQMIKIFVSGDLDEYKLQELISKKAPIDGFGIGTRLNTSCDVPYLDCVYKLQEYSGIPRYKHSEGKQTWPGRKQIYRVYKNEGMAYDVVTLSDEVVNDAKPLLQIAMRQGKRVGAIPNLWELRKHVVAELQTLPTHLKDLQAAKSYEVKISRGLEQLIQDSKGE